MNSAGTFVVDFVAKGVNDDEWRMVLVEEGPWKSPLLEDELRRLQNRLYDCIDAAIDGQLAERFPQTARKRLVIQVDGYHLPEADVRDFFDRFTAGVLATPDYRKAMLESPYVADIAFELNLDGEG
jgi:hypothetical protein